VVGRKQKAADRTWLSMECSAPLARLPEAVRTISALGTGPGHPYHGCIVVEIKFVAYSDATLRATRGQRHCGRGVKQCFDLWWDAPPTEKEWHLAEFETAMQALTMATLALTLTPTHIPSLGPALSPAGLGT
jgi:hypothetical protein